MNQLIRVASTVALAAALIGAAACGSASSPSAPTPIDPGVLPSMDLMLGEKTLGSATAPHEIIEYSSFTCPHCAQFQTDTMPQLKAQYIDTSRVRFVFRNLPRDTSVDLTAAMLARCAGDRYFDAVDTLFRNQAAFAAGNMAALETVMRNFGMSQSVIDACKASTTLRDAVLQMKQDALTQYQLQYVPMFILDRGAQTATGFQYISFFASWLS